MQSWSVSRKAVWIPACASSEKICQETTDLPTPAGPVSHRTGTRSSATGSPPALKQSRPSHDRHGDKLHAGDHHPAGGHGQMNSGIAGLSVNGRAERAVLAGITEVPLIA